MRVSRAARELRAATRSLQRLPPTNHEHYLLAAKVLESSGRHPEALASILDATPACATFSLPLTVTILLPPRRGVDLRWFGWRCTEGAILPSRLRLETSKDGTDYEEHQSVEVSARRELHCVRPIGPRTNFLRVTLEGDGEGCLAELTLYDTARPTRRRRRPAPPAPSTPASAPPPPQAAAGPSDDVLRTVAQLGDHVQRCAAAVTTLQRQLAAVSERRYGRFSARGGGRGGGGARACPLGRDEGARRALGVARRRRGALAATARHARPAATPAAPRGRRARRCRRRRRAAARSRRPLGGRRSGTAPPAAARPQVLADAARGVPHDEQMRRLSLALRERLERKAYLLRNNAREERRPPIPA